VLAELRNLTALDWLVVAIATSVSLLGALLPRIGNLLGRLFLGEDPLVARWKILSAARRSEAKVQRLARKEAKRQQKLQRAAGKAQQAAQVQVQAPPAQP
jgi:hypothetical protein